MEAPSPRGGVSRRTLINAVGRAGGVAAVYRTMAAMGLLAVPDAYAGPPALPLGNGRKVLILGAGIAGMVAAYELLEAGFDPLILEARARPGGRNWSLRAADEIDETDSVQHVHFNVGEHLYFNPGPARIPYHHEGILAYCRALGVRMEVMCNDNRGALMQDDAAFAGAPQLNRRVVNDSRGYIAQLAAKAIDQSTLDRPVSNEDKERLRAFLRAFGALDSDLVYRGSSRAGWADSPGAGEARGQANPPLDLQAIVASSFWRGPMQWGELPNMAATMLQPVGGMGRIGEAFGRKLWGKITYQAQVTSLRRTATGARVVWRDKSGAEQATEAPFVLVTFPLSVLRTIPADFTPAVQTAVTAAEYVPVVKVAFQAERRFWELDNNIYGGISWTTRDITQIWYPTAGLQQPKGILVGAYIWSFKIGTAFAAKPPERRLADTLSDIAVLHPDAKRWLDRGVSVAWAKIPFSNGAWAEWSAEARANQYKVLLQPDGPFIFAGEHLSWINGWQEGAVRSAHAALARVAERLRT